MSFDSPTELCAELPDKGRVIVSGDRKAVDPALALNAGCLLFHRIAHFALPGGADMLLGERHIGCPRFIAQPVNEGEMYHARLRIDLMATPAPIGG